jgi:carbon-monoxide dehydrogenase small subunit
MREAGMTRPVRLNVNGAAREAAAEPRTSLADFLREALDLTGTHVGLFLAVQAEGRHVTTIEGLAPAIRDGGAGADTLHPIQQAFRDKHGLQCGFCTPGIVLTAHAFLAEHPSPTHEDIREMLSGNLCRCTGYHFIVEAIVEAARKMRERPAAP